MLVCGYQYFMDSQLPTPGAQSSNVVTAINNYDQLLFNMYQQDLLALQYAYTIEATSNYMNYYAYSTCLTTGGSAGTCATSTNQIPSWEGMQAITFSVGSNATQIGPNAVSSVALAAQYLTSAQHNLVALYAARINALYKNILTFTISDNPLPTQTYAPAPPAIAMANGTAIGFASQSTMYATIQAATLTSTVNSGSIPGKLLNSSRGGVFYQYNGINQVWSCLQSSTTQSLNNPNGPAPSINLLNCSAAFPNSYGSYYDGVTMSAYGAGPAPTYPGGVVPTVSVNTNAYCNFASSGGSATGINYPIAWGNQLMCNIWAGTQFVNSTAFPGNAAFPPQVGGYITFPKNYVYVTVPGSSYYFQVTNSSLAQTFYEVTSSEGASPGYLSGDAGNFQYYSSNPWGINDGGFPSGRSTSEGQAHVALLQVLLPNGYILPFYLLTSSFNLATTGYELAIYGTLVCTGAMQGQTGGGSATPTGVVSCVQNSNNTGSITVVTTDGSSYSLSIGYGWIKVTPP